MRAGQKRVGGGGDRQPAAPALSAIVCRCVTPLSAAGSVAGPLPQRRPSASDDRRQRQLPGLAVQERRRREETAAPRTGGRPAQRASSCPAIRAVFTALDLQQL